MGDWAEAGGASWLDDELAVQGLGDKRPASRPRRFLDRSSSAAGKPIPATCGDWAATKAPYRFFENPRVTEHAVLAGHFAATQARFDSAPGPTCTSNSPSSRAMISKVGGRGRLRKYLPQPPSTPLGEARKTAAPVYRSGEGRLAEFA